MKMGIHLAMDMSNFNRQDKPLVALRKLIILNSKTVPSQSRYSKLNRNVTPLNLNAIFTLNISQYWSLKH